jgi:hypothetical protein
MLCESSQKVSELGRSASSSASDHHLSKTNAIEESHLSVVCPLYDARKGPPRHQLLLLTVKSFLVRAIAVAEVQSFERASVVGGRAGG